MDSVDPLKSQDVALLMKLLCHPKREWRQIDLSQELGFSQSEIAKSLARLNTASLVIRKSPIRSAALEFLVHGVKFAFPAHPGPLTRGVPTAISAPMHQNVVVTNGGVEHTYVWPFAKGKARGQSIKPLYSSIPEAALKDKKFYEMVSALDMLRTGRARERNAAIKFFERELK